MYRGLLLTAACAAAIATVASPAVAGGTFKHWDGASDVVPFGCPDSTVYGQTITIPADKHFLNSFEFDWINLDTGSFVARGEVYAWDGTEATGSALWEGAPRTFAFNDAVYHRVHFNTGVLAVTPGQQYVIFASIDKDYEQCMNNYEVGWGFIPTGDVYPGGGFVFQNNEGNENNWTTVPWSSFGGEDLAFRANLTP
jgi:hypothetical protein